MDADTAIGGEERLDPFAVMAGEILIREPAADPLEIGIDRARDRPCIESVAPTFSDHLVGAREIGVAEHRAYRGGLATRRIGVDGIGDLLDRRALAAEIGEAEADVIGDDRRHRHAMLGNVDRGREHIRPGQFPVALVQRPPAIERARGRDGHRANGRQRAVLRMRARNLQRQLLGRAARSGDAHHLAELGVPDQGIAIAADPARSRLEEAERGVDRDAGVDRRAALAEDLDPDLGRDRLRGSRRARAAIDRRARAEAGAERAVAGMDVGPIERDCTRRLETRLGRRGRRCDRPLLRQQRRSGRRGGKGGQEGTAFHLRLPRNRRAHQRRVRGGWQVLGNPQA